MSDLLPEDAAERRMFDQGLDLYGGDRLLLIQHTLRVMSQSAARGSSMREMLACMSNDLHKHREATAKRADAIEEALAYLAGVGASDPEAKRLARAARSQP